MLSRSLPFLVVSTLCLVVPVQASAEVYKWVDERGVVNYGDRPPARASSARPLELDPDSATLIPGIPKEELQQLRERDADRRLRQLEAEVEELRRREAARAEAQADPPSESRTYWYPAYGYPAYGYGRKPGRGIGDERPPRPAHPITRPLPEKRLSRQSGPAPRPTRPSPSPVQEPFVPVRR